MVSKKSTINLGLSFYTDDLPQKRQGRNAGFVFVKTNKEHGIRASNNYKAEFSTIEGIPGAVRAVLKSVGISLVEEDKKSGKKYLVEL